MCLVEETLNMTYKMTILCQPDAFLFAHIYDILNKSVKSQNPPGASLAPLSIFLCDVIRDVIRDVTTSWMGYLL